MSNGGYRGYHKRSIQIIVFSLIIGLVFLYLYNITSDPNISAVLRIISNLALFYSAIWFFFGLLDNDD
jgi:hypothetical protein